MLYKLCNLISINLVDGNILIHELKSRTSGEIEPLPKIVLQTIDLTLVVNFTVEHTCHIGFNC